METPYEYHLTCNMHFFYSPDLNEHIKKGRKSSFLYTGRKVPTSRSLYLLIINNLLFLVAGQKARFLDRAAVCVFYLGEKRMPKSRVYHFRLRFEWHYTRDLEHSSLSQTSIIIYYHNETIYAIPCTEKQLPLLLRDIASK